MIPVITIQAKTLPEVWEQSLLQAWEKGLPIKTEYDKPDDPPSKDCTMIMVIEEPITEPRIHRAFPGGLEDLEIYRQEAVEGVHDHWVKSSATAWTYTYHQRLCSFNVDNIPRHLGVDGDQFFDQMSNLVNRLAESNYTRRAQAITWNVFEDAKSDEPPCLQRIWCRLPQDEAGVYHLEMNTHWRSRDAFKAAFMNMWALTCWQKQLAEELALRLNAPVQVGRYVDISDSYHIYGSYFNDFESFLQTVEAREFKDRVWDSSFAEPFFDDAKKKLKSEEK